MVPEEIMRKLLGSKKKMMEFMQEMLGFYLPAKRYVTAKWMRDGLSGSKKLLKMYEVMRVVEMPPYKELSLKVLLKKAMEDVNVKLYLPSMTKK